MESPAGSKENHEPRIPGFDLMCGPIPLRVAAAPCTVPRNK